MTQRRVRVGKDNRPVEEVPPAEEPAVGAWECGCPVLDPADWHEVESDWSDIAFLRLHLPAVFGVPLGYPGLILRANRRAEKLGLSVPEDAMVLIGPGRVRRPVLVEVEGEAEAGDVVRPGGFAFSRLVPAPLGDMAREAAATREMAEERYGRAADAHWSWFLTCRECSVQRNFETLFVAQYLETRRDSGGERAVP